MSFGMCLLLAVAVICLTILSLAGLLFAILVKCIDSAKKDNEEPEEKKEM